MTHMKQWLFVPGERGLDVFFAAVENDQMMRYLVYVFLTLGPVSCPGSSLFISRQDVKHHTS